jgi:hypothetical protein
MKFLKILFFVGILALFNSCKHEFPKTPDCTWEDYLYHLEPFDLSYSGDFSDNFIMNTGGSLGQSLYHLDFLTQVPVNGDADSNHNNAKIVFNQDPDPDDCYSNNDNPTLLNGIFLINPNDFNEQLPDFYPYGKVGLKSLTAPLCNNSYSGTTSVYIRTDLFIDYKTGNNYYYLSWSTQQLADVSNGTTLSDYIPLTEQAIINNVTSTNSHASLIANDDNGYIYINGSRVNIN